MLKTLQVLCSKLRRPYAQNSVGVMLKTLQLLCSKPCRCYAQNSAGVYGQNSLPLNLCRYSAQNSVGVYAQHPVGVYAQTLQLLSSKVKSTPQGFRRGLVKGRQRICTVVSNIQKQVKTQHLTHQQGASTVLNTIVYCSVYVCTSTEIACIIFSGIKNIPFYDMHIVQCTVLLILFTIIESGGWLPY